MSAGTKLRWVAWMYYGDALAADDRRPGDVPVMGSNGAFDTHDVGNLDGPCIIVGRKGSHGKINWSDTPAWVTDTAFGIDKSMTDADLRWLYYALQTLGLDGISQDTGVPGLSREKAYETRLSVPSLDVQRRVAGMLDVETARIDQLIGKNKRVLASLTKRWLSSVEAATYGAGFEQTSLWLHCEITPGYAFPSTIFRQGRGGVRLLRGVNVTPGGVDWRDGVHCTSEEVSGLDDYMLADGDLVFGMDRPWISSGIRVARIREVDLPAALVQRVARLRPEPSLDADYLYLVMQTGRFYSHFEPHMTGISVPHVSGGQIGATKLPLPSLDEQQRIVFDLSRMGSKQAALKSKVERQIELLEVRRRSLITSAVTGQIDV